ncbi:MAG: response regulator [Candidatus Omnitrophota bacterium]
MQKIKVLIVEDENDLRTLMALELESAGYSVSQAGDGDEGLTVAGQIRPDIIISDVVMPKKDGNQFLKDLRKAEFGKKIPFVILTARVKMREYFELTDADAFLEKPFKMAELVDVIKKVLSKERKEKIGTGQKETIPETAEIIMHDDMTKLRGMSPVEKTSVETLYPGLSGKYKVKRTFSEKKKKVILLENDAEIYRELDSILTQWHCEVHLVANADECLQEAISWVPDIIILKEIFEKLNARELADRIKNMPRLQTIPVVIYNYLGEWNKRVQPKYFEFNKDGHHFLGMVKNLIEK